MQNKIDSWKDKILFTPGPLTTSRIVKQSMLRDLGSRDFEFITLVSEIRNKLLKIAHTEKGKYETILVQGSGTYGVEAVVGSTTPPNGKLLVVVNGAYGKRIKQIADILKIDAVALVFEESQTPDLKLIEETLKNDSAITNVWVVHCETTTGIVNPIKEIGEIAKKYNRKYHVDAMSSFGAVPIDVNENKIDYLITSANKCLEGVPGCSIVIAEKQSLLETSSFARSLSLDLFDQWKGLETSGQFRFTPPIQVILALNTAIEELELEGGVEKRAERYKENYETLIAGMKRLGFKLFLKPELTGYIITSFLYLEDKNFVFEEFYSKLNDRGQVIYTGKLSEHDCFRIGTLGRIDKSDVETLLSAIESTLKEMNINLG